MSIESVDQRVGEIKVLKM